MPINERFDSTSRSSFDPTDETVNNVNSNISSRTDSNSSKNAVNDVSIAVGYYGLLTDFYFEGDATDTAISVTDANQWIDVNITVGANGLFDYRIDDMIVAQPLGHSGDGSTGNPIVFDLEGLDLSSFANFRASMSFVPDEDEGQLETRLLFNRHSGATPSSDFSIEEVSLSMQGGADITYTSEPMLSFFVGDTIDTNAAGDAGKCRFQVKSTVAGVLSMRALTWYLHKQ